jgi:hypothetical protein
MKLGPRDHSELGPRVLRGVQVEPLVQVDAHPQTRLVNLEELPQPCAVQSDHRGLRVHEHHAVIPLRTFAGIERHASDQKCSLVELANLLKSGGVELLDLSELRNALCVGSALRAVAALLDGVKGMSRTQRETEDLLTPRRDAISARVRFCARNTRACSCCSTLPR